MLQLRSDPARFVAFSLVNDEPFMLGSNVAKLLEQVQAAGSLGIGHHPHIEVLDYNIESEARDIMRARVRLVVARERFMTVYRAEQTGTLEAVPFVSVVPSR